MIRTRAAGWSSVGRRFSIAAIGVPLPCPVRESLGRFALRLEREVECLGFAGNKVHFGLQRPERLVPGFESVLPRRHVRELERTVLAGHCNEGMIEDRDPGLLPRMKIAFHPEWRLGFKRDIVLKALPGLAKVDSLIGLAKEVHGVMCRVAVAQRQGLPPVTGDVIDVAIVYPSRGVMPKAPVRDALHPAVAGFYRMDYLLTRNCRHLANANKFRRIEAVNAPLGLASPLLVTPYQPRPWEADE